MDAAGRQATHEATESTTQITQPTYLIPAPREKEPGNSSRGSYFLKRFREAAERRAEQLAVIDPRPPGERLTYAQLDRRSDRLAARLRRGGVGLEVRVGLLMERSVDLVVALLAVWKAGGVYVPLDPGYPATRLGEMAGDADLGLLVTHRDLRPSWPGAARLPILDLGLERTLSPRRRAGEPATTISAAGEGQAAAYVIYTSGSTGRPKGVVIEQRSLAWYLETCGRLYGIGAADRVLQFSSISFDLSVAEIGLALAGGATLIFRTPRMADSMSEFLRCCHQWQVSVMLPPTAFWHELAGAVAKDPGALPPSLRLVSFGGEAALPERIGRWLEAAGRRVRLVNAYGPTEATIETTHYEIAERATAAIGWPAPGSEAYVLAAGGRPAAAGATGELCLAGPGLTRGYLGRPAETARRLVPHPFSQRPGERLYRTGDLARAGDGGELSLAGRTDHQIKIRGFRVELEEIESRLARHPAVRQAVVVAREDLPGHRYLTAHVVLEDGKTPAAAPAAELRRFLEESLPPHMVPAAWKHLPALPLTPNGKIDRAALASGAALETDLRRRPYAAPRTPIERVLARIWAEVLHLERVGAHDNVFELGGDSILQLRIVARAREEGLRLSPKDLFQHQTVAELAAVVGAGAAGRPNGLAEQGPVTGEAPLTPIQLWFFEQDLPEPHHYNQAVLLEVRRRLDPRAVARAMALLVEHHDALRLRFRQRGGQQRDGAWSQSFGAGGGPVPCVWIDISCCRRLALPIVVRAVADRLQASLDLEHGPLLRAAYFDRGPLPGRLLLVIHHLAVDGVSWRILLDDLESTYLRLEEGQPAVLPRKTTSYKVWAERLRRHAGAPETRGELEYWLRLPRDAPELPLDYPYEAAAANTRAATARVTAELTEEETRRLLRRVPAAYRTQINDVLLSALLLTLERWTGRRRLFIELEGHGREDVLEGTDLSRTVGWFTAAFPVHLEVAASAGPGEVLPSVKEQLRAIPRRGIGYYLLRYLGDDAAARQRLAALRSPQVSFNYLGQMDPQFARSALFGLATEPSGERMSGRGRRSHLLEIEGFVVRGRLWINWWYCRQLHRRSTMEQLALTFLDELRRLIAHCLEPQAGGFTSSDFPLAGLSTDELRRVVGADHDVEDVYPLAPVQEGILFHAVYAPSSQVYFEQNAWSLAGPLDADAFRLAWEQLIERHPVLRTAFVWQGLPRPMQIVRRQAALPWQEIDWRRLDPAGEEERFARLLADDRRHGFALSAPPLMRCRLVRLGRHRFRFVWSVHHLLLDGWSTSLLLDELFALYDAIHHGVGDERPRPRPYRDYVGWLGRQDRAAAEAFWRRVLQGFREPTPLPRETLPRETLPRETLPRETLPRETLPRETLPREALRGPAGDGLPHRHGRLDLDLELTAALRAFARRHHLTLNTLLQGAWALVLARASGHGDVVLGVTIADRPQSLAGVDAMVGLMINTLPVRVRLRPRDRLVPWLEDLQAANVELRQYAYASLVDIRGWSEVPHQQPLFESGIGFQNFPGGEAALRERHGQLEIGDLRYFSQTNYPLALLASPEDRLRLDANYDPARLTAGEVHRLLGRLRIVLGALAAAPPERTLGALPLLSAAERHQLLHEHNDTAAPQPAAAPPVGAFHALVEARARQLPETIALRFTLAAGEHGLSYRELDDRATRLARALAAVPELAGGEPRVGLFLERSPELVVAMLAVLKAGGAFVPLDPGYPRRRLAFMLEDAGVAVLLTRDGLRGRLPPTPARLFLLPSFVGQAPPDDAAERSQIGRRSLPYVGPESAAYVIYTSGSTGRPKGVVLPHRGLCNLVADDHLRLRPGDALLQMASPSFDGAVYEIAMALAAGATLDLGSAGPPPLGEALVDLLARRRLTHATLPTAAARELPAAAAAALPALSTLLVAGEACPPELPAVWARHGRRFLNGYGPTETTVCATIAPLAGAGNADRVPIGRPIRNLRAHVVDGWLAPLPAGVAGELQLGGAALGRGYLDRPGATAARFVPDPFAGGPGERLYRTGDVVRRCRDGQLVFLGRRDHQLKVRGYRVEPQEIEAALEAHEAVRRCAVVARPEPGGGARLVACVVPELSRLTADAGSPAWQREQVDHWNVLHDDVFGRHFPDAAWRADDPAQLTVGWNSSYDERPLPVAEMREWVDHTVARLRALLASGAPASGGSPAVLEIGCGAGPLVLPLAPHVERYVATDFSAPALAVLRSRLAGAAPRRPDGSTPRIELSHQRADDFRGLPQGGFDAVVLSSVVQYFPGLEYLLEVLRGALRATAPGGAVFLGDVRGLPMLDAFCASVELHQAPDALAARELRRRARRRRRREEELVLDPALFPALQHRWPEIRRVHVLPKRGRSRNELTSFRYDVVLRLAGGAEPAAAAPRRLDWQADGLTEASLRRLLATERPPALAVSGLPNPRLVPWLRLLELLAEDDGGATVADLRRTLDTFSGTAPEPEDVLALGQDLGYRAELSWDDLPADGSLTALFWRPDGAPPEPAERRPVDAGRAWASYANDPLRDRRTRELVPRLRRDLEGRLPAFMVPAAFEVLDALPLTPGGKVDRPALCREAPLDGDAVRAQLTAGFRPPRSATERALAAIWGEVLGVAEIGVDDDFFELGGHSLLATRVVSRIRQSLDAELPLRRLFDCPTIARLAAELAPGSDDAPPLVPCSGDGGELSFAQQRLWFLDQLVPASPAYNMDDAWRLRGRLDVPALGAALAEIVRRHEVLRATFPSAGGRPRQVVSPPAAAALPVVDLRRLEPQRRQRELARQAEREALRPFDLGRGPLIRVALVRLDGTGDEGEWVLLRTLHHVASDGWSEQIFYRELAALYEAGAQRRPSPLAPLPVQYADFAAWQRRWLDGRRMSEQLAYWRRQLAGLPVLELPADRPRPAGLRPHYRGGVHRLRLGRGLTTDLKELARGAQASLFMTLLAAFMTLLERYAGQTDVVVGSPIAGRQRREVEELIGFFVNTLVLRGDLGGDPPFAELLARVRATALAAYAHQDVPFERLVEELQPERDPARSPLFQVVLALHSTPTLTIRAGGLEMRALELARERVTVDLEVHLWEDGDGLSGYVVYSAALFTATRVARLVRHFERALAAVAVSPRRRLSEIGTLTDAERHQLLHAWNDTREDGALVPFQEVFAARAAAAPEAVAVRCGARQLTYGELDRRAGRLARRLGRRGVAGETLVGLLVERSPEWAVGALAVLKAGGAFVPLDPAYPERRLAFMAGDARLAVLLTVEALRGRVPDTGARVVLFDHAGESAEAPPVRVDPERTAYVIYTSGSTGQPKGAAVTQRGLANLTAALRHHAAPGDVVLQFSALSFDASVFELVLALASGASLEIASTGPPPLGAELLAALVRGRVSHAVLVPSALGTLPAADLPALRCLYVAGEACPAELPRRWAPGRAFHNLYGPTETSIWATAARCLGDGSTPAIGRPVRNFELHVLDGRLRGVPIGVPGELYLGGPGLGRGYLRRAAATAERFVPHPFSRRGGARLFKTGDRVRFLGDGQADFLGRVDAQVKLRGFRVEPGEIEAALRRQPGVREAVVSLREGSLAAYVVPETAEPATGRLMPRLRHALEELLPVHMVPAAFVELPELPLLPNGKVDRRRLPDPGRQRPDLETSSAAPRNAAEGTIVAIFSEELGLDGLGVHDDFFALGGHSLLAARVASRIGRTFSVELPLRCVFEGPTAAELAAVVSTRPATPCEPSIADEFDEVTL